MDDKECKTNQWYGRLASVAKVRANKFEVLRELQKTVAVPHLMYGMNVVNWSEFYMQTMEGFTTRLAEWPWERMVMLLQRR